MLAIKYAREHKVPFLGICFGMQLAVIETINSYSKIYESTEAFTDDLTQISDYITNLTGIAPDIYRFPGAIPVRLVIQSEICVRSSVNASVDS